jgi:hypothetical protein
MSANTNRRLKLLPVLLLAMAGSVVGYIVALSGLTPLTTPLTEIREDPLPHHIPKYHDGVSLRFAMVHDVIHERFARHGTAYYTERNRRVRQQLADEKNRITSDGKPSPAYFELIDDLGVGLSLLGKHEEAVRLMRTKLAQQEVQGLTGRELYSSYANLGTFLILWQLREGLPGDAMAKERIRESVDLVHKSIRVNPQSHFGREVWQAVIEEFLLAVIDMPEVLTQYDMIGDRLDRDIDPQQNRSLSDSFSWGRRGSRSTADYLADPNSRRWEEVKGFRTIYITEVGAEGGSYQAIKTSQHKPVPFDEPVLGIIGMWRLGGGANPHFALALGEIMLRVGQRFIAWCAYERASQMKDHVWPDPDIRQRFVDHCRGRQKVIEAQLPFGERAELRPRFEAELAFGNHYQQTYQKYEAHRIAQGASIDDPHFYDAFHAAHGPIASPLGEADKFVVKARVAGQNESLIALPSVLLFAGLFAFVGACLFRIRK